MGVKEYQLKTILEIRQKGIN